MKKKLTFFALMAICIPVLAGQRVNVTSELTMELADGMSRIETRGSNCIFSASNSDCIVSIYAIDKKSSGWNPKAIDKTLFPKLRVENLIKTKQDWFLQLGKDYIKRYYNQDGHSIVTFSSHTYSTIYVFLFESNDDKQQALFDSMLHSVKYKRGFIENAFHVYRCGSTVWFILFLIVSLFSIFINEATKGEDSGAKWFAIIAATLIEGVLLVIPLWGNLRAVIAAMLVFFVVNIIGGLFGVFFKYDG